jgi:hypothetical protein
MRNALSRISVLLFVVLFAAGCRTLSRESPQLASGNDFCCEWASYAGTNAYNFEVSSTMIEKTPVWRESDDQPPLPAREALRVARRCLANLVTDAAHWRLDDVGLSPLIEYEGHWIYLVKFYPPIPPSGVLQGLVQPMTIPVLMSGVAVQPKISHSKGW